MLKATVTKRNGEKISYDREKIKNAISKANNSVGNIMTDEQILDVTDFVEIKISDELLNNKEIHVEKIQDIIENQLIEENHAEVAKSYILYRKKHEERRQATQKLMEQYKDLLFTDSEDFESKRDNANINTNAPMGIMLKLGTEGAKCYADYYAMPEEFAKADKENFIHYHDKDFSLITFNCLQIDLLKVLRGGFSTGHGHLREPNSIRAYGALAAIILQSSQNDMFGGQSLNGFDYAMAEGVRKSFKKILLKEIKSAMKYTKYIQGTKRAWKAENLIDFQKCHYSENDEERIKISDLLAEFIHVEKDLAKKIYETTCSELEDETFQSMEALIHNLNSLHCLPYGEKIWIYDTLDNEIKLVAIGELEEIFEQNRFKAISLNKKTGESELKFITAIQKKDNNRNLVTMKTKAGQKVTTTDNHKIMYLNNNGKICEDIPHDVVSIVTPRKFNNIDVSSKIDISMFHSRTRQNYKLPYIDMTPEFAKIGGYYVADGSCSSGSQLIFTVCSKEKERELIALMKQVYGSNVTYRCYPMPDKVKPQAIHFNVGKVWVSAFKYYFGSGAYNKKIPIEILFSKNKKVKIEFLNGYFKCV